MKKILFLILILLSGACIAQTTIKNNLVISKTTPTITLTGTGGVMNFNADVTLTHALNTLTLGGGNLALGSNNLTMTGSLAATGSRVLKGWFTDLELTNLPTVGGTSIHASPTFTGTVTLPTYTDIPSAGVLRWNTDDLTLTHAANTLTLAGGNLALGANSLTMTGSIGATAARVTKGWFTDLESTNAITGSITGNAATVTGFSRGTYGQSLILATNGGDSYALTLTMRAGDQNITLPNAATASLGAVYSDTMSVSAGVLRTKATTITTEPYSVQIFSSGGKDITHAVADSVALNGGVIKLYVYSVDAITGAKIKILY